MARGDIWRLRCGRRQHAEPERVQELQGIGAWGKRRYTDDKWAQMWPIECANLRTAQGVPYSGGVDCAGLESDPQEGVSWERFQSKLYGDDIAANVAAERIHQSQGDREMEAEGDLPQATTAGQQLRSLRKGLEIRQQESSEPFITGRDFHREVIKADTHELLCRYVELSGCGDAVDADGGPSVGDADAFVSWNRDSQWDLLLLVEEHTRKAVVAGQPAPHYWLDLFAVNQHTSL